MSPAYAHVTNIFLELEFQHKGNKQTKKHEFSAESSLVGTDSENKII